MGLAVPCMFSRWRPFDDFISSRIHEVSFYLRTPASKTTESWIVSSFPPSLVMAHLFKTVVNTGLLLPIYFVPKGFLPHDVWSYCLAAVIL